MKTVHLMLSKLIIFLIRRRADYRIINYLAKVASRMWRKCNG